MCQAPATQSFRKESGEEDLFPSLKELVSHKGQVYSDEPLPALGTPGTRKAFLLMKFWASVKEKASGDDELRMS